MSRAKVINALTNQRVNIAEAAMVLDNEMADAVVTLNVDQRVLYYATVVELRKALRTIDALLGLIDGQ